MSTKHSMLRKRAIWDWYRQYCSLYD